MIAIPIAAFAPVSPAEAEALAALGRSDRTLAGLIHAAARAQYLRASAPTLGADAEAGLAAAEERACLELAVHAALDGRELRAKEAVLRGPCRGPGRLAAMLRAGLEQDRLRLATYALARVASPAACRVPPARRPRGAVALGGAHARAIVGSEAAAIP